MSSAPDTASPRLEPFRIGVIGAGRAGSVLASALAASGYDIGSLWSRDRSRAEHLVAAIHGAKAVASPQAVADEAQLVIIATPDRAIAGIAASIRWTPETMVVHVSGGTPVAALDAAARAGCLTGGWHPLRSFAGVGADATLSGITFAIEAEAALLTRLTEMTRAVGGRVLHLNARDRALYHASAVLASNALVALVAQAASLWERFGASRAEGLAALLPLAAGTVANLEAVGLPTALTGPVERGDTATVAAHLAALCTSDVETATLYRDLSRTALDIAREKGGLTDQDVNAMRELLARERVRVAV